MSFKDHPHCKPPKKPNVTIWRYMNIPKFISILEYNKLFFPKISILPDQYEGLISNATIRYLKSRMQDPNEMDNQKFKNMLKLLRQVRDFLLVCSWSMSKYESAAMWRIYLKDNDGLAIKSTYPRLVESFKNTKEDINIGVVDYIDFEVDKTPMENIYIPALTKKKIYRFEDELRVIYLSQENIRKKGVFIPVDLKKLIYQIILAPKTDEWIKELIIDLLNKYNLKKDVLNSEIDKPPLY